MPTTRDTTSHPAAAGAASSSLTSASSAQEMLYATLTVGLDDLDDILERTVRPLPLEVRSTRPPGGGWCVDEVLEHLCLANSEYLQAMQQALRSAPDLEATRRLPPAGPWRPSIAGRLLVRSLTSSWRQPTVRQIAPQQRPRPAVLDALLDSHTTLRSLLEQARPREWTKVRMSSPFARLIRLNLGDAALVILRHGERHARQITRTAAAVSN